MLHELPSFVHPKRVHSVRQIHQSLGPRLASHPPHQGGGVLDRRVRRRSTSSVLQYSPYFDQPNPWLSCPFRLSLHVVGKPTRLIGLIPRTARRENRCPLTPLAHFYTSDRHENWWVYRFEVAEQDAGDSKSNG